MTRVNIDKKQENPIAASWQRCERQHNLVRDTVYPILRLQSSEVAPRFEEMVARTGGRQGVFRQLAETAVNAGQILVVSDADGILVRLECDDNSQKQFERYGIALGSCWDERVAGTNGVSMAMLQNKPVTVRGSDHFFSRLHPFACTATTLVDADNQKIGAISLAAIDRGNTAEHIFAQQLLGAAADKIQRILFTQQFREAMVVTVSKSGNEHLFQSNELVAVDDAGIILGSTTNAHRLISLNAPTEMVGKAFESVFGADIATLDRIPERVVSTRYKTGPMLNLSMPSMESTAYPGRGWRPSPANRKAKKTRRRLAPDFRSLAVGSEAMASACEQAADFFARALPFIIEGESGTGKSSLITALHNTAGLSAAQLILVDCAMLDEQDRDRGYIRSIFEQARVVDALDETSRETALLVFDNVDEMPGYAQAALRNFLASLEAKDSAFEGRLPTSTLRVIATSRNPLKQAVEAGRFRDDLYYLLGNARLSLPPLRQRERPEAIALALSGRISGAHVEISAEAQEAIKSHPWPGNVRELRSTLYHALMAGDGGRISLVDLAASTAFDQVDLQRQENTAGRPNEPHISYDEKSMLLDALNSARWNVTQAARKLGIGRATIHRKMKQHNIIRPAKPATN